MPSNPIHATDPAQEPVWQVLATFNLPGRPGSDHLVREQMAAALQGLTLLPADMERLKAAVAEAMLSAIEHSHRYQLDLPVTIQILVEARAITRFNINQDSGSISETQSPGLAVKMAGQQSPRSWGFFLIKKMADDFRVGDSEAHHTIRLFLYLEGGDTDDLSFR